MNANSAAQFVFHLVWILVGVLAIFGKLPLVS